MLVFTNRVVDASVSDESAFSAEFAPGRDVLGMAQVARRRPRSRQRWSLTDVHAAVSDGDARAALAQVFDGDRPILLHLHGNGMPPAACFERCARFEELFGVAVIGFSWPSEGRMPSGGRLASLAGLAEEEDRWTLASVTGANYATSARSLGVIDRYLRSKENAKGSVDAIARFFQLVGEANAQAGSPQLFSIAAHSLGVFCLQMVVEAGLGWRLPEARNLALLAACVPNEDHAEWVSGLRRSGGLMVTTNLSDLVLLGAFWADRFEAKLGASNPVPPLVDAPESRYVDFARRAPFQHEYFIAERGKKLDTDVLDMFTRVFRSGDDIPVGSDPCDVYDGCCDGIPQVCDMGV